MQKISLQEKTRRKMNLQAKRAQEELKEEKERQIKEKSEKKFEEWKNKKNVEEMEKKKVEKEKQRKKEEEKMELEKKCQVAYDNWLKKAKSRPQSAPNNFGYTSGKLAGTVTVLW